VTVKPTLECLEARDVPSANPLDGLLGQLAPGIVPLSFNLVSTQGGQGTAFGQIGANPIQVPVSLTATPGSNGAEILNLHLNPISLDLLGLNVQTSSICLDITAQPGSGNLLGNLLFNVTNALDLNGGNLTSALSSLSPIQTLLFDLELTTLLNGAINSATSPSAMTSTSSAVPSNACDILNLSVGPLNLNLLGLDVDLNNCASPPGPVTVDVFATHDGLLGNLLCDVSHLLDPTNTSNLQLGAFAGQILQTI
jgi:hypothetical protein